MRELPKTYHPQSTEPRIYELWEKRGHFTPRIEKDQKPFVIILPPPNVTGELHLGHAQRSSVQDLMIRWHRMRGEPTLWLPGVDHASIGVHVVIERDLAKRTEIIDELLEEIGYPLPEDRRSLTRDDLGRDWFLKLTWAWINKYRHIISDQQRSLGASLDWTRERFTMDPGPSRAVRTAFVRLFQKGLIYRGEYIIHWCPKDQTAVSDLEVKNREEKGQLWTVKYPLEDGGHITVATTRPETILGDTAVVVHPEDERYKELVGKIAILPVLGRRIPIITDEAVDPNFGTGAVKVTPGHDPQDYEIGRRQGLPIINIMNKDATLNENAGPYARLDRFDARKRIVEQLQKEGLLVKVQDHIHSPGRCDRCDTLLEPLVSEQWFVRIKPLAEPALAAVQEGRVKIVPPRFAKVYFNWMENIRDWCISRQLWWGHRIPVWYCENGHMTAAVDDPDRCATCGSNNIQQDPDVLDTWFSSGLWPFSTLGWGWKPEDWPMPEAYEQQKEDMDYFYPTSVLETAYDILFFWVARMIMLGLECAREIPFHAVLLGGLVLDPDGQRMSKSKGNVIDPRELMKDYGTDALRFTLVTSATPGNDMKVKPEKVEDSRNFANKVWNMARFILANLPEGYEPFEKAPQEMWQSLSLPDRWILSRHHRTVKAADRLLGRYQFGEAGRAVHDFLWSEFADWYIEASKIPLGQGSEEDQARTRHILVYIFERSLRLLHPFMPFVTEEIWQHLPHRGEALIVAPWPEAGQLNEEAEVLQQAIWDHIRDIRNRRAEEGWLLKVKPQATTFATRSELVEALQAQKEMFARLARVDVVEIGLAPDTLPEGTTVVTGQFSTVLVVPINREKERKRLQEKLERLKKEIARAEKLLSNRDFVKRAPKEVVQRETEKLARYLEEQAKLQERLAEE